MLKSKNYKTTDTMQAELEAFVSSTRERLAYFRSALTVCRETATDNGAETKQRLDALTDPQDQIQEKPCSLEAPHQQSDLTEPDPIDIVRSEIEAERMAFPARTNANATLTINALMSDKECESLARLAAIKQRLAGKLNRE